MAGGIAPFCGVHINHRRLLHPASNQKTQCLLVVDCFLQFIMVFPVTVTGAQATIVALEKRILLSEFRNPSYMTEENFS